MSSTDVPFSTQQKSSLPELMYSLASLSELFDLGLAIGTEMEPEEARTHILTHMRRAIRAQGACLLLYYKAQRRFVTVASQGEKLPCGTLASILDSNNIEQFSARGPGMTLSSVQLEDTHILLVSLTCRNVFIGFVALTLADVDSLLDERGLLLTYMGSVAAQILYTSDIHSNELRSARSQERNRIARDLHDGVIQQLTYVLYKLEFIRHLLEANQSHQIMKEIEHIANLLNEGLQELRSITTSLLPSQLNAHTFGDALASLLQIYKRDNPTISLEQEIAPLPPMPARLEAAIFRVIQEALNNIRKHAQATRILLRIQLQPDLLRLEIHDNGCGFDQQYAPDIIHSGLRGMQERVRELAGTWQLVSQPETGTTIHTTFPLVHSDLELTQRESEVLQLIVAGLDNHAIARKLSIRNETVQKHVQHITQKLQVKDRPQVAAVATKFKRREHMD